MIENYQALTLGRYMKINAVLDGSGDELGKQVHILAILADMEPEQVLLLPLADYARMAAQSGFLREPCPVQEIPDDYTFQGLVPTKDFTKINTAQYVDFQGLAKGFPKTLPELLAVFLVPEGRAYNDGYDLAAVQDQVREMPFPLAMALAAFFFNKYSESIAASLTSWDKDLERTKDPEKKEAILGKILEVRNLLASVGGGLLP